MPPSSIDGLRSVDPGLLKVNDCHSFELDMQVNACIT